mgnify:CR=1 FL=1|tara:strand:+ start:1497 stop:1721 length:225 start_codon:yes stop_codon:yes gene_type:complete
MRLQLIVDDILGHELQTTAHNLGFSTSSYIRYLIKKSLDKNQKSQLDLSLDDIKNGNTEAITLTDFKKQIDKLC